MAVNFAHLEADVGPVWGCQKDGEGGAGTCNLPIVLTGGGGKGAMFVELVDRAPSCNSIPDFLFLLFGSISSLQRLRQQLRVTSQRKKSVLCDLFLH